MAKILTTTKSIWKPKKKKRLTVLAVVKCRRGRAGARGWQKKNNKTNRVEEEEEEEVERCKRNRLTRSTDRVVTKRRRRCLGLFLSWPHYTCLFRWRFRRRQCASRPTAARGLVCSCVWLEKKKKRTSQCVTFPWHITKVTMLNLFNRLPSLSLNVTRLLKI